MTEALIGLALIAIGVTGIVRLITAPSRELPKYYPARYARKRTKNQILLSPWHMYVWRKYGTGSLRDYAIRMLEMGL